MGYETRIHVVKEHTSVTDGPRIGEEIASIDLCKCDGPVLSLVQKAIKRQKGQRPFALWARTPDQQSDAVELLRVLAKKPMATVSGRTTDELEDLASHLDDGTVTVDKYGDPLGVISVPDFIAALRSDILSGYRRYVVALAMLESIVQNWPHEVETGSMVVVTYGH